MERSHPDLKIDCNFPETLEGVITYAAVIDQIIRGMGRNDVEFGKIHSIVANVRSGTWTAADGLLKLSEIPVGKQDYN